MGKLGPAPGAGPCPTWTESGDGKDGSRSARRPRLGRARHGPQGVGRASSKPASSWPSAVLRATKIRLSLDLSRVQWAVLAACSTAAGASHDYEGIYGLGRAFRLAGARTVLLSLWPVEDQATSIWSEALYRARVTERADTPAAMQAAQRAVLAARRKSGQSDHPWYWAGFLALGDWR